MEANIGRPLKNSFSLGLLFPDDDGESSDELRQSLSSDDDESDEKEGLLESATKRPHHHRNYGSLDGSLGGVSGAGDLGHRGAFGLGSRVGNVPKPERVGMHRAPTAPGVVDCLLNSTCVEACCLHLKG